MIINYFYNVFLVFKRSVSCVSLTIVMKGLFRTLLLFIFIPSVAFANNDEEMLSSPTPSPTVEVQVEESKGEGEGQGKALAGEIELEFELKNVNQYGINQNFVISAFKEVKATTEQLALKADTKKAAFSQKNFIFSDRELLYFASSYLYCVSKKGICSYMLDALLEVDFLALCNEEGGVCKKPKKVTCANMTRMWKTWIDNDLEQRLSHSIPIGLMGKYNKFKQTGFSKYLKCSRTLLPRIKSALRDKSYLLKEYSDKEEVDSLEKTIQYLSALKQNIANVISLQGIE